MRKHCPVEIDVWILWWGEGREKCTVVGKSVFLCTRRYILLVCLISLQGKNLAQNGNDFALSHLCCIIPIDTTWISSLTSLSFPLNFWKLSSLCLQISFYVITKASEPWYFNVWILTNTKNCWNKLFFQKNKILKALGFGLFSSAKKYGLLIELFSTGNSVEVHNSFFNFFNGRTALEHSAKKIR